MMTEYHNYQINHAIHHIRWLTDIERWEFFLPNTNDDQATVRIRCQTLYITRTTSFDNVGKFGVDCKSDEFLFISISDGIRTHVDDDLEEINCKGARIYDNKEYTKFLLKNITRAALSNFNKLERQDHLGMMKAQELLDNCELVPVALITELEIINSKAWKSD